MTRPVPSTVPNVHASRIERTAYVMGRKSPTRWAKAGSTSRGNNAPETKIAGK